MKDNCEKNMKDNCEKARAFKLVIRENWDINGSYSLLFPGRRVAPEEHIVCTVGLVSENALRYSDKPENGGYKQFECKYLTDEQIVEAFRELLPQMRAEAEEWEEKHG